MSYKKLISFIGLCLIPFITLLLCLQTDMFHENMTYVANQLHYHTWYQLWSIFVGIYFFIMMRMIYQQCFLCPSFFRYLHVLLLLVMILGAFVPYDMIKFPWLSSLHVDLSLSAALSYLLFLMIYLFYLYQRNFHLARCAISYFFIGIMMIMMFFIFQGKITGWIEFLYITSLSWYMVYLIHLPL